MSRFPPPRIVVSRCLEFDDCRHDGQKIPNEFVRRLQPFTCLLPVCPEVEIGLGVPRPVIRLVSRGDRVRLVQPEGDRDLTARMNRFSREYLGSLSDIDGFLLKNRSPSCAPRDARVYPGIERVPALGKGAGLFAAAVGQRFPGAALVDEGRLTNARIREHFFTQVFTLARFRSIQKRRSIRLLIDFHAEHKLLLMGYHQAEMRQLGRLLAGHRRGDGERIYAAYLPGLERSLQRPPRTPSIINVLQHAFGYFSRHLSGPEKRHFLRTLDRYRSHKVPLSVLQILLRTWVARFGIEYLDRQFFFEPFPEELADRLDSGSARSELRST